jgi:hypothetical protein
LLRVRGQGAADVAWLRAGGQVGEVAIAALLAVLVLLKRK